MAAEAALAVVALAAEEVAEAALAAVATEADIITDPTVDMDALVLAEGC